MNKPQIIKTDGEDLIVLSRREYYALRASAGDEEAEDAMTARIVAETASAAVIPVEVWRKIEAAPSPIGPLRQWRKLTQGALADKTGLSQGYLSEIETGKKIGDVATLRAIATALDLTLDDVVSGEGA